MVQVTHPSPVWGRLLSLFVGLLLLCVVVGCDNGAGERITEADPVVANDPNAAARALLDEFYALPEGEAETWVSERALALSVFDTVTDAQIRAEYEAYVRPHLGSAGHGQ